MVWKPEYGKDICKCGAEKAKASKQCRACYEASRQQSKHPKPGYNLCDCGNWKWTQAKQCKECDTRIRQENAGADMIDVVCTNCGITFQRWPADLKDTIDNAYCSVKCRNEHFGVHPNLDMSVDLAYILGISYGDGHVSDDRFVMSVTEMAFAQSAYYALERLNFRPSLTRISLERLLSSKSPDDAILPTKEQYRVSACSREFVRWYRQLTFDVLSDALTSPEYTAAFLRGFYESDGSVQPDYLAFYNTNERLLGLTEHLAARLGFAFKRTVSKHLPSGKTCYALSIHAKQAIGHFLSVIQPRIKNQLCIFTGKHIISHQSQTFYSLLALCEAIYCSGFAV